MNPRDIFFTTIYDRVKNGEDIVVITSDLAAPSLDRFRVDFPDHYVSVGIAEQNLIAIASGLSMRGKKVVAWGLNPFIVIRAVDQLMNTVALFNLPIIFAGLHAGLSSAVSGPTHVVISDLSIVRTFQNVQTYNLSDTKMCDCVFEHALRFDRPYYFRFDKDVNYELERKTFSLDHGYSYILSGSDILVVTSGYHVGVLKGVIEESHMKISLLDVFRIPCDAKSLSRELKKYKKIVLIEEHILQGGFTSYILEIMCDYTVHVPVVRKGINIEKGYTEQFGERDFSDKKYGLDAESIKEYLIRVCK